MKCNVCDREMAERGFCLVHLKAHDNIVEKFKFWKNALTISWKEYLSEIEQNPLTGEWSKEIASYLISNEGT